MGNVNFTSDFFVGNRQKLRASLPGGTPIVLAANGQLQQAGDTAYPFRQDASFWYLTGIDEPDVLYVADDQEEYLIVPARSAVRQAFDGAVDEPAIKQVSGVASVYDEQAGWERLSRRLRKVKQVATLPAPAAYIEGLGMYTNPARRRLQHRMKQCNQAIAIFDIAKQLAGQRMVKQAPELAAIEEAIRITIESLEETLQQQHLGGYGHEYEVEADLSRGFRLRGADGHAFAPTIASGKRACTLHNTGNAGQLTAGQLLLCDVGASYNHYAADITRTVGLGTPTTRQVAVYNAVHEVHSFALSLLKPGVVLKEYEAKVEAYMGEQLQKLGLVHTVDKADIRKYYPHSTSHFLGINVHDVGLYDQPLEVGAVLTVEPGIYIPDESIGIRLEDDVLITSEGNTVLSSALPLLFP